MDDELSTVVGSDEIGKAPWEGVQWVVEQRIDGAHQGVVAVIDIELIGLPAALHCCRMNLAHPHHFDVSLEGDIRGVTFVVKPVGANHSYGVRMFLNKVDHLCRLVDSVDVRTVDGLSSEDRVNTVVYGARLLIIESHFDVSQFRCGINVLPLSYLSTQYLLDILHRDDGIRISIVDDERERIVGQWDGDRHEVTVFEIFLLFCREFAGGDG